MLDVHRLRLLRELDRRGTLAAVARALNYSPSAISQQLSQLEAEAGVKLLEQAGRGVRLTAQARILASAVERLRPGGRLVYCVCSLEPEEGEAQVEALLRARPDVRLDPAAPGQAGAPEASLLPGGTLRILPHHRPGGTDGFFVARLVRLP